MTEEELHAEITRLKERLEEALCQRNELFCEREALAEELEKEKSDHKRTKQQAQRWEYEALSYERMRAERDEALTRVEEIEGRWDEREDALQYLRRVCEVLGLSYPETMEGTEETG